MNVFLKYNLEKTCRTILMEQLETLGLQNVTATAGNLRFNQPVCKETFALLAQQLSKYGIEILDDSKAVLVQKTKDAIAQMLIATDLPSIKISSYLSEKVGESYRTISHIFSEVCCISVESFIIMHKIEHAKRLLINENMSLTEIAYQLHYSSVAHLSNQFKKITGLTPTAFHKVIINKRNYSSTLN